MTRERDLIDALAAHEDHLDYDQLAAIVDGRAPAPEHVQSCASCAADLEDLRATAAAIAPRRPWRTAWLAAAAALLIAALLYFVPRPPPAAPPASVIAINERAAALRRERGTLMGPGAPAFDVLAPAGTFVRERRPRFSWKPLSPGAVYSVEIYEDRKLVMQSPQLRETTWQPAEELRRGGEYLWQVVATDGTARVIAPQPPAGEARFGIVDEATAAAIVDAEGREPLERALRKARAGLLDEARADAAEAARRDPQSAVVRKLQAALR